MRPILLTLALLTTACGDKTDDTAAAETDDTAAEESDTDTDTDDTGNCTADIPENTICVDLDGTAQEIANGVAWDGQGSLAGSIRLMWSADGTATGTPRVVIDISNDVTAGDQVVCDDKPTYVQLTDADGSGYNANRDFAYWGGACTVTLDEVSLTPGDEVVGHFVSDVVNGEYTTNSLKGTFRATIIEL